MEDTSELHFFCKSLGPRIQGCNRMLASNSPPKKGLNSLGHLVGTKLDRVCHWAHRWVWCMSWVASYQQINRLTNIVFFFFRRQWCARSNPLGQVSRNSSLALLLGFETHETLLEQVQVRRFGEMDGHMFPQKLDVTILVGKIKLPSVSFSSKLSSCIFVAVSLFRFPSGPKVGNFDTFAVFDIHESDTQGAS